MPFFLFQGELDGMYLSHPSLNLSFLEPAKIRVMSMDGTPRKVEVRWRRIGPTPLESSEFPPGIGVTRDGDLVVWAAGEEHEGTYEAEVRDPATGETTRLTTIIRVEPMLPPTKVPVPPGKAGEVPEEVVDVEPPQPTGEDAYVYYVTGFTPDSVHCETPKWTLVDKERNTTIDISDKGKCSHYFV